MRTFSIPLLLLFLPGFFLLSRPLAASEEEDAYHHGHQFFLRGDFARAIRKFEYLFATFPDSGFLPTARYELARARVRVLRDLDPARVEELKREIDQLLDQLKETRFQTPLLLDRIELQTQTGEAGEFPLEKEIQAGISSSTFDIPELDRYQVYFRYAGYLEAVGRWIEAARYFSLAELGCEKLIRTGISPEKETLVASDSIHLVDLYAVDRQRAQATLLFYESCLFLVRVYQNPCWLRSAPPGEEFPFWRDRAKLLEEIIRRVHWILFQDRETHSLPASAYEVLLNLLYYRDGHWESPLARVLGAAREQKQSAENRRGVSRNQAIRGLFDLYEEQSYKGLWVAPKPPKEPPPWRTRPQGRR